MNTMYKQTPAVSIGRRALTTKVVHTFLGLAMLAMSALTASSQPAVNHIGEEIPQVAHHICPSCGEEIPQRSHNSQKKMAGGARGGVVNDRSDKAMA